MRPTRAVADTCIWIGAYSRVERDHQKCMAFVDEVIRGRHRIVLPWPALPEIVCRLAIKFRDEKRDPREALIVGDDLQRRTNVEWIIVDKDFSSRAAKLGVMHDLRGMDAMVAYAALQCNCELITNDRDFLDSSIATVVRVREL